MSVRDHFFFMLFHSKLLTVFYQICYSASLIIRTSLFIHLDPQIIFTDILLCIKMGSNPLCIQIALFTFLLI